MEYPFFLGMRTDRTPHLLKRGELSGMRNLEARLRSLVKRRGIDQVATALEPTGLPRAVVPVGDGLVAPTSENELRRGNPQGRVGNSHASPKAATHFTLATPDYGDSLSPLEHFDLTITALDEDGEAPADWAGTTDGAYLTVGAIEHDGAAQTTGSCGIQTAEGGALDLTAGWSSNVWTDSVELPAASISSAATEVIIYLVYENGLDGLTAIHSLSVVPAEA